jgi:hypothetical protein
VSTLVARLVHTPIFVEFLHLNPKRLRGRQGKGKISLYDMTGTADIKINSFLVLFDDWGLRLLPKLRVLINDITSNG